MSAVADSREPERSRVAVRGDETRPWAAERSLLANWIRVAMFHRPGVLLADPGDGDVVDDGGA